MERLDSEALAAKQSQEATLRLTSFYRSLGESERAMVNEVVADWVLGNDDRRRFDALALIQGFEIRSAVPAMRQRLASLAGETAGPAGSEREKIERIAAALN